MLGCRSPARARRRRRAHPVHAPGQSSDLRLLGISSPAPSGANFGQS
jgi:hypothetical protein